MKGNTQIIAELNKLLKNELTAINQYFLHARTLKHWGFERMAKKIYDESIGEMKHADRQDQGRSRQQLRRPRRIQEGVQAGWS